MFTPQTPVTAFPGTFGVGFGTSNIQGLLTVVKSGLENAQSGRNIDLQQYNPAI